jgi:hypothetical protein
VVGPSISHAGGSASVNRAAVPVGVGSAVPSGAIHSTPGSVSRVGCGTTGEVIGQSPVGGVGEDTAGAATVVGSIAGGSGGGTVCEPW